jgi:hypothetical protein
MELGLERPARRWLQDGFVERPGQRACVLSFCLWPLVWLGSCCRVFCSLFSREWEAWRGRGRALDVPLCSLLGASYCRDRPKGHWQGQIGPQQMPHQHLRGFCGAAGAHRATAAASCAGCELGPDVGPVGVESGSVASSSSSSPRTSLCCPVSCQNTRGFLVNTFRHDLFCKRFFVVFFNPHRRETPKNVTKKKSRKKEVGW